MIEKLIAFSARNAVIVLLLILAIVGGGVWAIRETPIDAIPDLSDVQVIVTANWEGRSPTPRRNGGSPFRVLMVSRLTSIRLIGADSPLARFAAQSTTRSPSKMARSECAEFVKCAEK